MGGISLSGDGMVLFAWIGRSPMEVSFDAAGNLVVVLLEGLNGLVAFGLGSLRHSFQTLIWSFTHSCCCTGVSLVGVFAS